MNLNLFSALSVRIKIAIILLFISILGMAQEVSYDKMPSTFTLFINQDNAFGFYPAVGGSFGLNDRLSATFYSIFWTNAIYGTPDFGTDLWTEMGVGLSFTEMNDKVFLNPSIGFTHGKLLSGGTYGVPFDGIVPNFVGLVSAGSFESEIYAGWYKALRKEGEESFDYMLYWIYSGVILSDHLSLGAHYEGFALTRRTTGSGEYLYHWLGGYVKLNIDNAYTVRFSAGTNMKDGDYSDSFYKLTVMAVLK
jgi:hypothetical protein